MLVLSKEQEAAAQAVFDWFYDEGGRPPFCLAGFAGSGKTTIIPAIIDRLGLDPSQVAFMAPSAKAARVMTRRLRDGGINERAYTIHKSIYHPPLVRKRKEEEPEEDWILKRLAGRASLLFEISKVSHVWRKKLIVVDEASMVDDRLVHDLMLFGVPILAIGDPGQLPPVERQAGFNLLEPSAFLSEIHRQALESPIIRLAHAIREGKYPRIGEYGPGVRIVGPGQVEIPTDIDAMPTVIVGTHRKRWQVTDAIRGALGFEGELPRAGEKVICCKNSRTSLEVVNGAEAVMERDASFAWDDQFAAIIYARTDEGEPLVPGDYEDCHIECWEDEDGENYREGVVYDPGGPLRVYRGLFDEHVERRRGAVVGNQRLALFKMAELEHVDFGWAITCHKAQGSQWDNVLVLDESHVFRGDWSKWLYTAVTRAASNLTIVTG